jgi:hypothetical protein
MLVARDACAFHGAIERVHAAQTQLVRRAGSGGGGGGGGE